jgi:hypothetical protein
MDDIAELIFGMTPMRTALDTVLARFTTEIRTRPADTLSTLFLLSDGEPTDGSPREGISAIRRLGVTVVACFVTEHDIADPRTLFGKPDKAWPSGARLMFDAASQVADDSDLCSFLLKKGWTIHPGARLFVQLNHTDVLNEFMDVLALPVHQNQLEWQLPPGEAPPRP